MPKCLPGVATSSGKQVVIDFRKLRFACASRRSRQLHDLAL
jgi:hypothetical protein